MASTQEEPWRQRGYLRQWAVPTDRLSQVTDQFRLNDLICGIIRVTPPYRRSGDPSGSFQVILMTHGRMYLDAISGVTDAPLLLETGDVLILPRGSEQRFFYPRDVSPTLEVELSPVDYWSPPGPNEIEYIGLMCYLDRAHRNLLTDFLPPVIHLKHDSSGIARWLQPAIDLFRAEYHELFRSADRKLAPGCSSALGRLAEFICIESLRSWIEQMPAELKGWLLVLKDEGIATAVQAVHEHPEREGGRGPSSGAGVRSGCVTHSPESPPAGRRTGRGGPTPPERTPAPDTTRPDYSRDPRESILPPSRETP